jgi:formamidopyrimidine-DNA glycosylase
MPELPEVETVRRLMQRVLAGHTLANVEVVEDSIVFKKAPASAIREALIGRKVKAAGRKGKYWWLEMEDEPNLFGHLGMAGWVREVGQPTVRLREHGEAPLDDENGRPRFLKLLLTTEEGRRIALTDGRRLARAWLGGSPETDPKMKEVGPDVLTDLPSVESLHKFLSKRKAPVKALLQDQGWISGIGNWIADEVLYHARIAPQRNGNTLSEKEVAAIRKAIQNVVETAVDAGADSSKYPEDWLFHVRWGGGRGHDIHMGQPLIREQVGGRTTAWVPSLQK